jgi:Mor family transcriptional regulator
VEPIATDMTSQERAERNAQIYELRRAGMSIKKLALRYDLCNGSISMIARSPNARARAYNRAHLSSLQEQHNGS